MQPVQLSVDDEVKGLGDSLKALIVDIKAKKSAMQITTDVLPGVIAGVTGISTLGADLKKVDNQVYLAKCIAEALEG